jgi:hypothetical protein
LLVVVAQHLVWAVEAVLVDTAQVPGLPVAVQLPNQKQTLL